MGIVLEISSKNYADDSLMIKKALSQLEGLCMAYGGYVQSEPSEKFGWTFYKIGFKPELQNGIETKFADMLSKYRWSKDDERFAKFMQDYFRAKNIDVKVKVANI